jgi:hypothetical protein
MALAELIDNSLEAHARHIEIIVERDETHGEDGLRIAVVDDGDGMDSPILAEALRFGGSTRFDSRDGQGRFGMGLPNASVSQARRVEAFSWTDPRTPIAAQLDIDALAESQTRGIPRPESAPLPDWVRAYARSKGTAIVWTRCDRIHFRRVGMLARQLHREFGRVFRRFIARGVAIRINGDAVAGLDPVRIVPSPALGLVTEFPAMIFPFADPRRAGRRSHVEVRFTLLPVALWADLPVDEKRSYGITNCAAVSVLRADREVALGWHLLGAKKRENYDDWWRCEISFEPCLDEFFGVTHSKQGIRPSEELIEALAPSLEAQARRLNREVRDSFENVRRSALEPASLAQALHHKLVLTGARPRTTDRRLGNVTVERTQYRISQRESSSPHFAEVRKEDGIIDLRLNINHPFFRTIYQPLHGGADTKESRAFDLWLLAFARAMAEAPKNAQGALRNTFLTNWSDATALLLEGR